MSPEKQTGLKDKVTRDIRCLTQAIHSLQPQGSSLSKQPTCPTSPNRQVLVKAYTRLAILLTQGTNSDEGAAHHIVAVAGRLYSEQIDLIISQEGLTAVPSPTEPTHTKNATTLESGLFNDHEPEGVLPRLERLKKGTTSLADLANIENNRPHAEVPLSVHASDLIHALRLYSMDVHNARAGVQFAHFTWLRCHRKICHRILASKLIFGDSLQAVLKSWQPNALNADESRMRIQVPKEFASYLEGIANRRGNMRNGWLYTAASASEWRDLVCGALSQVWDAVHQWKSSYNKDTLRAVIRSCLHFRLLLSDDGVINRLLAIKSLQDHIDAFILDHAEKMKTANIDVLGDQIEYAYEMDLIPDLDFEQTSQDRRPRHAALLYCHSIVSWLRVGMELALSKFIQKLPDINVNFHVIHTTPASRDALGFDLEHLEAIMATEVQEGLRNKGGITQDQVEHLFSNGLRTLSRKTSFGGTIHCEATLMALVSEADGNGLAVADNKELDAFKAHGPRLTESVQLSAGLQGFDRVIGLEKKSCFCCFWLARALSLTGEGFIVPGTNGSVLPWSPPAFGIPLSVLQELRVELVKRLVETIWEAGKADMWSRQSSSVSDGVADNSSSIEAGIVHSVGNAIDDMVDTV